MVVSPLQERRTALRQDLVDAHTRLEAMLDRAEPDGWQRTSPNEGWLVRDLLVHLTTSETGFLNTLRKMAAGSGGVPTDFDSNRWNASQVRRWAEADAGQLRAELAASHLTMLDLLDTLDEAALDQPGRMSNGQDGTTETTIRLVASHKREHTADIEAAL